MSEAIRERILVVGDNHVSSNNRGNHVDYAKESLEALEYVIGLIEPNNITRYVGLGDISYGKFDLNYRVEVERLYQKRAQLLNGKVYELRGNHDMSNRGVCEWEYYSQHRKLMNTDPDMVAVADGYKYLDIGGLRLHFVDYSHEDCKLKLEDGKHSIVFAHNYLKFKNLDWPNYGKFIELDYKEDWFGIEAIFCGHIHKTTLGKGFMVKDGQEKEVLLYYPGSIVRTDFIKNLADSGEVLIINYELVDGKESVSFERLSIPWWPAEKAFQLGDVIKEARHVDISDVVKSLNDRERNIGDPEVVIHNMTGFEQKYKDKAVQLLRE